MENAARAVRAVQGQVPTPGYSPPEVPTSLSTQSPRYLPPLVPTLGGWVPRGSGVRGVGQGSPSCAVRGQRSHCRPNSGFGGARAAPPWAVSPPLDPVQGPVRLNTRAWPYLGPRGLSCNAEVPLPGCNPHLGRFLSRRMAHTSVSVPRHLLGPVLGLFWAWVPGGTVGSAVKKIPPKVNFSSH